MNKMAKKILLALIAVLVVAGGVAALSAFEAHIINVTAHINIALSSSFLEEPTADDVEYIIRQKPKPIDPADAEWCHTYYPTSPYDPQSPEWSEYLGKCYYPLCSYLSKTDTDPEDQNDGPNIPAFHDLSVETYGRLAKSQDDITDSWTIDLDVPCFEGYCAQDWDHPGWELPVELEGSTFGCDIWVEVTEISRVTLPSGEEETNSVALENKNENGWYVIDDETFGTLVYVVSGPTFDYTFTAQGLNPNTDYSLIYYADPWPGNHPGALIGSGTSDDSGNLNLAGNPDLNMDLPHPDDANYSTGAKIWLVLSSDYDSANNKLTAWNQTEYLFEYNLITYDDTNI